MNIYLSLNKLRCGNWTSLTLSSCSWLDPARVTGCLEGRTVIRADSLWCPSGLPLWQPRSSGHHTDVCRREAATTTGAGSLSNTSDRAISDSSCATFCRHKFQWTYILPGQNTALMGQQHCGNYKRSPSFSWRARPPLAQTPCARGTYHTQFLFWLYPQYVLLTFWISWETSFWAALSVNNMRSNKKLLSKVLSCVLYVFITDTLVDVGSSTSCCHPNSDGSAEEIQRVAGGRENRKQRQHRWRMVALKGQGWELIWTRKITM